MTLTIIIDVQQLSGEFRTLILNCLKLKPTYLVVNSDNKSVIDYFINHYRKNHLTCFKTNLKNLTKEVAKSYQTQYYLSLNSVDPELTDEFLNLLLENFKNSKASTGHLIRSMPEDLLFSTRGINATSRISLINQNIIFKNLNSTDPKSIHYMISNLTLDYQPKEKLVNRSVMIFGALGGIGSQVAAKYRKMGWSVIGIDLPPKSEVLSRTNLNHYYDLDLSSSSRTIRRKMNSILSKVRRLDHLVHAAGLQINGSIKSTRSRDFSRIISVNLKSIFLISQMCFPKLQKTVGSMVVVNSVHSYVSSNNISAYAISKSALLGLVRNFAIEWGPHGIRVNGIAPGAIRTKMLMDGLSRRGDGNAEENFRQLQDRHLMGRIGQPEEIANFIYFMGSENCFITGQTIIADGGASLILSTEVE